MNEPLAPTRTPAFEARLRKRYAAERRFRALGLAAILFSLAMLAFLLGTMTLNGVAGFQRAELAVPIDFREAGLSNTPTSDERAALASLDLQGLAAVVDFYAEQSLGAEGAAQLSPEAWRVAAERIIDDPSILREEIVLHLPATKALANALSGDGATQLQPLARQLSEEGKLSTRFDPGFMSRSDATDPQMAGIWGALKGSMLTMVITLLLAFPIGVMAALYLEEYAPRNRWTDLIEVSINNLAAVPSIIFGVLGLAVFLWMIPNYRSAEPTGSWETSTGRPRGPASRKLSKEPPLDC